MKITLCEIGREGNTIDKNGIDVVLAEMRARTPWTRPGRVPDTGAIEDQGGFEVYQWNHGGAAATLADIRKVIPRQVSG
ncbi:MAG: hypothetical protein QN720_11095, partial [Nitrososphaeraceae archaeon]|nr:hypothetical protein [Nitrososphaeraceae archaeon]